MIFSENRNPLFGIMPESTAREATMDRRTFLASIALTGLGSGRAFAQTDARAIRLIVGAAAGGAIDPYARLIAEHMTKTLNRPVVVENKPGANGTISAQFIVDQPADGTLVWVGTQAMTEINPVAYSNLRWSIDDFIPLIKGVESAPVFVTHPSVPAKSLSEFVTWVKTNPTKLSIASWSPGTPSAFLAIQLAERFGLDLVQVPYRGSGPQTNDLIAGHALMGFAQMQSSLPHVRAGKLNALAITGPQRSRFLPETPTFAELGYPDFTATVWFGLLVKRGTPPVTVTALTDAARAAHNDPDVKAKLEAAGFEVSGEHGPRLMSDIKGQIERWGRIVKATGFKAD
jgi:tripartite-type tricarboxylate transporter receptor subunit TctC